jgi:hypothetical protein
LQGDETTATNSTVFNCPEKVTEGMLVTWQSLVCLDKGRKIDLEMKKSQGKGTFRGDIHQFKSII